MKKLLEILQTAYDKHKDRPTLADSIKVEFWLGDKPLALDHIGQFNVVPDLTIHLKEYPTTADEIAALNDAEADIRAAEVDVPSI